MLLRDIERTLSKAGVPDTHADVLRASEVSHEIAEYANNMMMAGRISGFNVSHSFLLTVPAMPRVFLLNRSCKKENRFRVTSRVRAFS